MRDSFPDLHYEEHEIISQGNKVVFVGNIRGTHKFSSYLQYAVHIHKIGDDGKIIEHKVVRDDLKLMMQLGVIKPASGFETHIRGWKNSMNQYQYFFLPFLY